MIELKYIKAQDYKKNRKLGKQKLMEAINQITEYKKDKRLDKKHLRCYAVVFVGSKIYECIEVE